ncbi:MAG TPA: PAS domain-containing protein, partial [Candidatus Sulfotelmatobacter sp.]|nr:PAS domain-containing protein [Candidatus Sulfotelmatobacter sp.]
MSTSRRGSIVPNRDPAVEERSAMPRLLSPTRSWLPIGLLLAGTGRAAAADNTLFRVGSAFAATAAILAIVLALALAVVLYRALHRQLARTRELSVRLAESDAARREAEHRHAEVTSLISDFIWELDAAGRLLFLSPRFEELYGYPVAEMIGQPLDAVLKRIGASPATPMNRVDARTREPLRDITFSFVDRSGAPRHARLDTRPRHDADGRYVGHLGTGRDETELVKAAAIVSDVQHRTT